MQKSTHTPHGSIITLRHLDAHGKELRRDVITNTMTYAAMDILMDALLRSGPASVTHLYARFGDSGANPGYLVPPSGDLKMTNRNTFVQSSDSVRGGLWVPILNAPIKSSSNPSLYRGNQGTFYFRIPYTLSTEFIDPAENFNPATSYIYAIGLAVAMTTSDRSQDVIITVKQASGQAGVLPAGEFAPFPLVAGGQTAVDYMFPLQFV